MRSKNGITDYRRIEITVLHTSARDARRIASAASSRALGGRSLCIAMLAIDWSAATADVTPALMTVPHRYLLTLYAMNY